MVAGALVTVGGTARAEEKIVKKSEHKEAHAEDHKVAHGEGKAEAKAEAHAEAHCDGEVKVEVFKNGRKVEGGVEALPPDMRAELEKWRQEADRMRKEFLERAKAAGKKVEFRERIEMNKGGPKRGAEPCDPAGDDAPAAGKPEPGERKCGGEIPEEKLDPNADDVTRRVKKIEKDLKKGDPKAGCGKEEERKEGKAKPDRKAEGANRVAPVK